MFFSLPVFLSLLWTLLKADIIPDVLSVLSVGLAHKIVVSLRSSELLCNLSCRPADGGKFDVLGRKTGENGSHRRNLFLSPSLQPTHAFLLALFTCVREKGFTSGVPRLMQLTYKVNELLYSSPSSAYAVVCVIRFLPSDRWPVKI